MGAMATRFAWPCSHGMARRSAFAVFILTTISKTEVLALDVTEVLKPPKKGRFGPGGLGTGRPRRREQADVPCKKRLAAIHVAPMLGRSRDPGEPDREFARSLSPAADHARPLPLPVKFHVHWSETRDDPGHVIAAYREIAAQTPRR